MQEDVEDAEDVEDIEDGAAAGSSLSVGVRPPQRQSANSATRNRQTSHCMSSDAIYLSLISSIYLSLISCTGCPPVNHWVRGH